VCKVVAFADGEDLDFVRMLEHELFDEPRLSGVSFGVDDELNLTRVGIGLEAVGEDLLVEAVVSLDGDGDGIDEIDPFHDSSILDVEAWELVGDEGGGGLGWLFLDPDLELREAVGCTHGGGKCAELLVVTILLAVCGGSKVVATGRLEMGLGRDTRLGGVEALVGLEYDVALEVRRSTVSDFTTEDEIRDMIGESSEAQDVDASVVVNGEAPAFRLRRRHDDSDGIGIMRVG